MVMKTTSGTKAVRSWADMVKGKPENVTTAVCNETLTALPEETSTSELPQPALAASEPVAEVIKSSGRFSKKVAPPQEVAPLTPPGIFEAAGIDPEPLTLPNVAAAPASLKPGTRGGLQCFCRGKVLSMLSHYGWIATFGTIDHPLAAKHFGRIYAHIKDVQEGHTLAQGDTVSFFLYVDNVGLGAEGCRVEGKAEVNLAVLPKLRAEAAAFVPGVAFQSTAPAPATHGPVSDMFVRMSRTFESIPANGYVQMVGAINFDDFDSDSSSEDGDDGDADRESLCDESDGSCPEVLGVVHQAQHGGLIARLCQSVGSVPTKVARKALPDTSGMTSDSTNAGTTSDSETEGKVPMMMMLGPPGLFFDRSKIRPPPGLEDMVPMFVG